MIELLQQCLEVLKPIKAQRVGSTVVCNPAPQNTDTDIIMLVKDRQPSVMSSLGFDLDTGGAHYEPSEGQFNSWRKDELNVIVTDCEVFYEKFIFASRISKALNLLKKEDRIKLFQAVLYSNVESLPSETEVI